MLMMIYNPGSREELVVELETMKGQLHSGERRLLRLTDTVIGKLGKITDEEFDRIDHSAEQLTKSREQWTAFLTTVARLYKYPYYDQLLIHAQRPQATACAEYDFWRNRMNRYVKRGSHGIGLIDVSGMKPRLHYVFDVADTGERADSRPVQLWKMEEAHRKPIEAALEYRFGTDAELDFRF